MEFRRAQARADAFYRLAAEETQAETPFAGIRVTREELWPTAAWNTAEARGWLAPRERKGLLSVERDVRSSDLIQDDWRIYFETRLTTWESDGLLSRLEPLSNAQAYVHRMVDNTPGEREILMASFRHSPQSILQT